MEIFHFVFTVGLATYVIVAKIKSFNLRANGDHRKSMVNATGVWPTQPTRSASQVELVQLQYGAQLFNRYIPDPCTIRGSRGGELGKCL